MYCQSGRCHRRKAFQINNLQSGTPSSIGKQNAIVTTPVTAGVFVFWENFLGCPFLPLFSPVYAPFFATYCQAQTHELIRQQADTIRFSQRKIEQLEHYLEQLLRRQFGPRRERLDPNQLALFEAGFEGEPPPRNPVAKMSPKKGLHRRDAKGAAGDGFPMTCPVSGSSINFPGQNCPVLNAVSSVCAPLLFAPFPPVLDDVHQSCLSDWDRRSVPKRESCRFGHRESETRTGDRPRKQRPPVSRGPPFCRFCLQIPRVGCAVTGVA